MKTNFLFPHYFKKIGWVLLFPILILDIIVLYSNDFPKFDMPVLSYSFKNGFEIFIEDVINEILIIFTIVTIVFVVCSKEKNEDEFIQKIRFESLLWAVYVNYGILIILTLFVYFEAYLQVMIYNMFTPLLLFLIRFNYILFKNRVKK